MRSALLSAVLAIVFPLSLTSRTRRSGWAGTRASPLVDRTRVPLLAPTRAGLDRDEWIALLGALGVLAGLSPADASEPARDVEE